MTIRPIKTEADYEMALSRISALFESKPNTNEGDELDVLSTLVEAYEAKHFPIESPDPVSAIKFRMNQQGLKSKDFSIIVSSAGSGRNKSFDLTISATPFIYFTNDTQYSTSDPSIEVTYLKSGSFSTGNWFEDFLIQLRNRFGGNSSYSNDEMARFSVSWEHDDTLPVNKRNECYSATVTLEYTAV